MDTPVIIVRKFPLICDDSRPIKVILSRKGFDSSSGGHPSLILSDGQLISFPIPEEGREGTGVPYSRLSLEHGPSIIELAQSLDINTVKTKSGSLEWAGIEAHLDPDLNQWVPYAHPAEWRPLFGQSGQAQSHLANCNVEEGDLFLFFGRFRWTGQVEGRRR